MVFTLPMVTLPVKADTTLAFVKYKLDADSITLAVYKPFQVLARIVVADIKFAPVTEPPIPVPKTTEPADTLPIVTLPASKAITF